MYTSELKKGVNLHIFSTDKFQSITMCILLRLPLKRETSTANALLASAFMQGCAEYKTRRHIERRLEDIQSVLSFNILKKGEEHIIQLFVRTLPEYFDKAAELAGDILLRPLFNNEEACRRELEATISSLVNDKRRYAFEKCIENMCENEAYGISGDGYIHDINSASLHMHYNYVMQNAKTDIMIVGNINEHKAEECIRHSIPLEGTDASFEPCNYLYYPPSIKEITEEMDITQGKLCVGLRLNTDPSGDDWYKAVVANELFGGGASSALFNKVREEDSLCYYITSKLLRFKSIMVIEAGIDSKNRDKVLDIIMSAMQNVSDEGIENAKKSITDSCKIAEDKPESIMDSFLGSLIAGRAMTLGETAEKISNVGDIDGVFDDCHIDTVFMLSGGGEAQ